MVREAVVHCIELDINPRMLADPQPSFNNIGKANRLSTCDAVGRTPDP
jgi:hypothetical protein